MTRFNKSVAVLTAVSGILTSCATTAPVATDSIRHEGATGGQRQQLNFQLESGVYGCEFDQRVEIQRNMLDPALIELKWQGNIHTLRRYDSSSGLPRYEDRQNGLLWIDLPWKSVLMDVTNGRPLADGCKAVSS